MYVESYSKINEINVEANDKIKVIVDEIRAIRFSKLNEKEKQVKYDLLPQEFEKVMRVEEKRIEDIMKNSLNF